MQITHRPVVGFSTRRDSLMNKNSLYNSEKKTFHGVFNYKGIVESKFSSSDVYETPTVSSKHLCTHGNLSYTVNVIISIVFECFAETNETVYDK